MSLPQHWHSAYPMAHLDGIRFCLAGHRTAPAPCLNRLCHHIGEFEVDSWLLLLALSWQARPAQLHVVLWMAPRNSSDGTQPIHGTHCSPWRGDRNSWQERRKTCHCLALGMWCWAALSSPAGIHTKGYILFGWEMMVWRPQERMN